MKAPAQMTSVAALGVLIAGCAVGPTQQPSLPAPSETFASGAGGIYAPGQPVESYWKLFEDSQLERLIVAALEGNRDLRAAQARLRAARSFRNESAFDFLPTMEASAGYTESQLARAQALPGQGRAERRAELYDAGFDAFWEIDIFGRVRGEFGARRAEARASLADFADLSVSVAAETARNYFELRGLQEQLAVARRNAENQQRTLELTEVRLQGGRGTELDSSRARALLATTLSTIPALEAAAERAIFRLGVLTGRPPADLLTELTKASPAPTLPTMVQIGSPTDLLRRRPDVRAAEMQLAAATARTGIAVADLFPRVTFVAQGGFVAPRRDELGDPGTDSFAFGPQLTWPALDLARVYQRLRSSRARADEALALYEQTVLLALEDAEASLTTYARTKAQRQFLEQAAAASAQAAKLAALRFEGGVSDFLAVLDAERTLLEAEDRLARARTSESTALVAVFKALGGTGIAP
jgi:multidrug efflux system outer membrane protein